tara:strand:+ start:40 stop:159 length:120 start_codon:yes stop_codon:yes gene_type:complete
MLSSFFSLISKMKASSAVGKVFDSNSFKKGFEEIERETK